MLNNARFNLQIITCHKCRFSQTRHTGGCAGPCPCHIDRRDIIDHARLNYCPAGYYPFNGLGSAVTWVLWHSGAAYLWLAWKRWHGAPCECGERAAALDRLGARMANMLRGLWRRLNNVKGRP